MISFYIYTLYSVVFGEWTFSSAVIRMTEVLNPKVEAYGLADVLGMALVKQIEEKLASPYIGNGTIKSGLIKGVVGGLGYAVLGKGRVGKVVTSAVVFDAAEDVIVGFLGGRMAGQAAGNDEWA